MWNWTPKGENKPGESFCPEATHIGKSIVIKGEVSGSENVYVAGELEGSVELLEGNLTRVVRGDLVTLTFSPNQNFRPPSLEARVFGNVLIPC